MSLSLSLILVSDPTPARAFALAVEGLGYSVRSFMQAAPALETAIELRPDLILLDSPSEPLRWLQACRSFRAEAETRQVPMVVTCGPASSEDRQALLEAGADDCWTEPLDSRACLFRLQAFARRSETAGEGQVLRYADVEFDLRRFKVRRAGKLIDLTPMQMKLLKHFMQAPTVVFSRKELLESLWDNAGVDEGAVTACVLRLRRALNAVGPNLIRLVPLAGYSLDGDADGTGPGARPESELSQSPNTGVMGRS